MKKVTGIGGIFFDYQDGKSPLYRGNQEDSPAKGLDLPDASRSWQDVFSFVQSCGRAFLPAYLPIVERRRSIEYGQRERDFQLYRRGRYVEFNLV